MASPTNRLPGVGLGSWLGRQAASWSCFSPCSKNTAGKPPAERPMGSLPVVLVKPSFGSFSCLSDRLEEPPVQAAVSEYAVESLVVTILPRALRLDESCIDAAIFDPLLDFLRHELRTVVALHNAWLPVELHELFKNPHHIDRSQMPCTLDPSPSPRELIDHRQETERLSIARLIRH